MRKFILAILSIITMMSCGDDENTQRRYASSYYDDNLGLITINEYAFIYDITYDRFSENITGMTETINCSLLNPTDDDGNPISYKTYVELYAEDLEPDDYTISWEGSTIAVITYSEQLYSKFENRQTLKMLYYESDGGMWANIHDMYKRNTDDYQNANDYKNPPNDEGLIIH